LAEAPANEVLADRSTRLSQSAAFEIAFQWHKQKSVYAAREETLHRNSQGSMSTNATLEWIKDITRVLDAFLFLTQCIDHGEGVVTGNAPGLPHLTPYSVLVLSIEFRRDINRCQKVEPERHPPKLCISWSCYRILNTSEGMPGLLILVVVLELTTWALL
jgi:hypothetical protein